MTQAGDEAEAALPSQPLLLLLLLQVGAASSALLLLLLIRSLRLPASSLRPGLGIVLDAAGGEQGQGELSPCCSAFPRSSPTSQLLPKLAERSPNPQDVPKASLQSPSPTLTCCGAPLWMPPAPQLPALGSCPSPLCPLTFGTGIHHSQDLTGLKRGEKGSGSWISSSLPTLTG